MPEEEKKEEKKEKKKDEKKDQKKEQKEEDDKIVLEAHMHCESCRYKVYRALMGYPGVEEITIDMKGQKVVVKGKVDAEKLFETVKKKSGNKITKLVSFPEPKKEERKKDQKDDKKENKKKEAADVTVVLKVQMHCGACIKKVEKAVWKIPAVYSVKVEGEKVTIKGKDLEAVRVCEEVKCRSGRHAEVVPPPKKEQEKKEAGKKEDTKEKSDGDDSKEGKKEGGNGGKGGGGGSKEDKKREEAKEKEGDDAAKREEKMATVAMTEYVYAPQYFSDENPNACVVM